jgi:hypothetical protein
MMVHIYRNYDNFIKFSSLFVLFELVPDRQTAQTVDILRLAKTGYENTLDWIKNSAWESAGSGPATQNVFPPGHQLTPVLLQ